MVRVLAWKVVAETTARRFCWGVSALLTAACMALVLAMLPEFGIWTRVGLMSVVVLSWMVLGAQFSRMIWLPGNRTAPSVR